MSRRILGHGGGHGIDAAFDRTRDDRERGEPQWDGIPYTIYTVLADNGIQFTDNKPVNEEAEAKAAAYWAERDEPRLYRSHSFAWACEQTKIEHRLTKPRCLWTNGQVERMNRTIKDATVKRYHFADHDELRRHLQLLVEACNYGCRLKTQRGLTPYEFICQTWTK